MINNLQQLLDTKKFAQKKGSSSERAELIGQFVEGINSCRINTKYKPVTAKLVGIKLAHLSLSDMYFFLKKCEQSGNFSRCFFGLLKTKK